LNHPEQEIDQSTRVLEKRGHLHGASKTQKNVARPNKV
jgi:hypothetical protein